MIKCTNFLRKYVTSTPLFHEKTHFFKKKSRKTARKSSRYSNTTGAGYDFQFPTTCKPACTRTRKTNRKILA